jgi:hypothetical protein
MAERDDEFVIAPPVEGAGSIDIDMSEINEGFAPPLPPDVVNKSASNLDKAKSILAGLGTGAVGAHVGAALGAKDVLGSLGKGLKGTVVNYFGTDTGVPSDAQNARIRAGTTDAQGTTGRARMGFNEVTAAQAAQRKEVERVMQELARRGIIVDENILARMPGMSSSPQGLLMPSSAVYEAGEAVAPKAGSRIGQFITSHPFVSKTLGGGLGGFGVGYGVSEAARKGGQGDYLGAGLSGLEALASGASMVPAFAPVAIPASIGLGGLSELVEMSRRRPADTKPLTPEEQKKAQQAAYGVSPAYMAMMARRRAPTMLAQD